MAQVPGIKLHKTAKGKLTSVTISMKHHGDKLQPVLEQIGAVEQDEFDRRWRAGFTVEEVFDGLLAKIDGMKWDK